MSHPTQQLFRAMEKELKFEPARVHYVLFREKGWLGSAYVAIPFVHPNRHGPFTYTVQSWFERFRPNGGGMSMDFQYDPEFRVSQEGCRALVAELRKGPAHLKAAEFKMENAMTAFARAHKVTVVGPHR
jgi:hypothetical protein